MIDSPLLFSSWASRRYPGAPRRRRPGCQRVLQTMLKEGKGWVEPCHPSSLNLRAWHVPGLGLGSEGSLDDPQTGREGSQRHPRDDLRGGEGGGGSITIMIDPPPLFSRPGHQGGTQETPRDTQGHSGSTQDARRFPRRFSEGEARGGG